MILLPEVDYLERNMPRAVLVPVELGALLALLLLASTLFVKTVLCLGLLRMFARLGDTAGLGFDGRLLGWLPSCLDGFLTLVRRQLVL
jgi:hypothetical protein